MNQENEKLSALTDEFDASDPLQAELDGMLKDVNQRYTMRRYQMIGDVMRNELPDRIQLDFTAEVMAKIQQEPALNVSAPLTTKSARKSSGFWSGLFKPAAGLAIAASVAFVAITSVQLQQPSTGASPDQLANVSVSQSAQKVEQLARLPVISNAVQVSSNPSTAANDSGMKWKIKRGERDMQNKLNTYLINHNEYSSSMHGIIPQVRVVGFDVQK